MSKKEKKRENRLKSAAPVISILTIGGILLQVLLSQFLCLVPQNTKGVTI